jgi:hypothetical protein
MSSRMLGRLLTAATCLLLGFIISVSIAWAAAIVLVGEVRITTHSPPVEWPLAQGADWPSPETERRVRIGPAARSRVIDDRDSRVVTNRRSGWPLVALQSVVVLRAPGVSLEPARGLLGGVGVPDNWVVRYDAYDGNLIYQRPRLPLVPVLPGLAVDTALFAFVAWLALFGHGSLRRTLRRRRGRCPQCAYELGGLVTCPECGTRTSLAPVQ